MDAMTPSRPFSRQKSLRRPSLEVSEMDSPLRSSLEAGVPPEDVKPETPSSASCGHVPRRVFLGLLLGGLLLLVCLVGGLGLGLEKEVGMRRGLSSRLLTSKDIACTGASESEKAASNCPPSSTGSIISPTQNTSSPSPYLGNSTSVSGFSAAISRVNITQLLGGNFTGPANVTNVPLPRALNATLGNRIFHITAIRNRNWAIKNYNPTQLLAMLGRMRTALGSPFSLFAFVDDQYGNGTSLIGNYTLDDYLLLAQEAAGGYIIPSLNLDYYSNPFDQRMYPCTNRTGERNGTIGPECFWSISDQVLALKAIAMGPRIALLISWMTFNRCAANPAYCSPAGVQGILSELHRRGWRDIMPANIGPFNPTYGLAGGVVAGVVYPASAPWLAVDQGVVNQTTQGANITKVYSYINAQSQICPMMSAMDMFLANLNATQKAVGLTNMAQSQASGNYTYIYPMWVFSDANSSYCENRNQNPGYWDATTALQANGSSFFDLIMNLVKTYN